MTVYLETSTREWGATGKYYLVSTFNTDKVKIYSKDDRYGAHEKTLNDFVKMFKREEISTRKKFIIY